MDKPNTGIYQLDDILALKNVFKEMDNNNGRFNGLIAFNTKYANLIKNSKVKITGINPIIPIHLIEKYGPIKITSKGEKALNVKIRDIFIKISKSNYLEMIEIFKTLNINENKHDDEIPTLIFETLIDIIYLIDVTILILDVIHEKYIDIFNKIIDKCINYSDKYLKLNDDKKAKLWRLNNCIFLGKLYAYKYINIQQIITHINHYISLCKHNDDVYIFLISNIINNLKKEDNVIEVDPEHKKIYDSFIDNLFERLEMMSISKDYSVRAKTEMNKILCLFD